MLRRWIPLLLVLVVAPALAAPWDVYVNNRPFPGQVVAGADDVLLDAEVLCRMLGVPMRVDLGSSTLALGEARVPVDRRDGRVLVSGRAVTTAVGGRYAANRGTGTVDLYVFDVMAASVRARQRILEKPRLESDAELQVLSGTVRHMMENDLGLRFRREPQVRLADDATMTSAGLARKAMGGVVTDSGRLVFLVRRGTNPLSAMATLAFDWGTAWAVEQGIPAHDATAQGMGLWTSYNLLERLEVPPSAATYGAWQGEGPQSEFLRLLDVQARGGPEAVREEAR